MTPAQFNKERKALVKAILAQLKSFFWESGFVKNPATERRAPVMLWVPRNAKGEPTMKSYSIRGALVISEISGFTEDGVITGGYGHMMVTTYWAGIPIEDLYRLNQWMLRMMPKLTTYDVAKKAAAKSAARAQRSAGAAQQAATA